MKIFIIWLEELELFPFQLDYMHKPDRPQWDWQPLHAFDREFDQKCLTTKQAEGLNTRDKRFYIMWWEYCWLLIYW